MAFEQVQSLEVEVAIQLGGRDKKTGKANPTTVEGYYLGSKDIPSKFSKTGLAKMHVFQTDQGSLGVYGKTDLDRKMLAVAPGLMTRVTQKGSVPTSKGNDMLTFKVEVDKDNRIDIENPILASANSGHNEEADEAYVEELEDEVEEAPPARPRRPARAAAAPSAAQQAKVQALLSGVRTKA